ncbi:hypothetical protein NDU88_006719 [Pleurodeles waltl]|uniref:Uncharacterized protein n=1 Tax=Pleurodeles waltl TaxID=8319 RepID=A0AAV7QKT2_PLEWA|nr:hypothetical protein NDU88_006719 [Pleurodeles waltl]
MAERANRGRYDEQNAAVASGGGAGQARGLLEAVQGKRGFVCRINSSTSDKPLVEREAANSHRAAECFVRRND